MESNFRKILALLDYTEASLHAAREAALIASKFEAELQLLHISPDRSSKRLVTAGIPFFEVPEKGEDEYYGEIAKLESVKKELARRYAILITCFENRGEFVDVVTRHVKDFSVDLIVLGTKKRSWLKELLVESKAKSVISAVGCEVLCVSAESKTETLKKIVVPVSKSIPKKKIGIAYELAKKFTARIYLVALNGSEKKSGDPGTKTLIASFRYLKDLTNIPIECNTVAGDSLANATMHYAQIIGADLILIDEGSESDLKRPLWNGSIVNHSSVSVLSVQPINDNVINMYSV
ncbi:MAG TPA: universal stress protein [Chitinophagaceae bacterium]|nr:universal stress protein [Chitinophagaceae bacterium]